MSYAPVHHSSRRSMSCVHYIIILKLYVIWNLMKVESSEEESFCQTSHWSTATWYNLLLFQVHPGGVPYNVNWRKLSIFIECETYWKNHTEIENRFGLYLHLDESCTHTYTNSNLVRNMSQCLTHANHRVLVSMALLLLFLLKYSLPIIPLWVVI